MFKLKNNRRNENGCTKAIAKLAKEPVLMMYYLPTVTKIFFGPDYIIPNPLMLSFDLGSQCCSRSSRYGRCSENFKDDFNIEKYEELEAFRID